MGRGRRTLTSEYPPPDCILSGRSTATTSMREMVRAYQRDENAAVKFWGRKVYGVWPVSIFKIADRVQSPLYLHPILQKRFANEDI